MNDSSYIILRWTFMREGIFFLKKSKPTMFQPKMRMVSERERIGVYYVLTFYVVTFIRVFSSEFVHRQIPIQTWQGRESDQVFHALSTFHSELNVRM